MTRGRLSVAAASLLGGTALIYTYLEGRNYTLTTEPPRIASDLRLPERETLINLRADIPLSVIRNAANEAIPAEYRFEGTGPDIGGTIHPGGWNIIRVAVKVGTHYDGTIRRTGNLSITGASNTIEIALPIAIEGNGGLRGDGARMLGLNAKNFRTSLILKATLTIGVNPDWTPAVDIKPDLQWTDNPKIEIAHNAWVDIGGQVDGKLREQVAAMAQKVRDNIPPDIIRRQVEKSWHVYSIRMPDLDGVPAWANIVPVSIGVSGASVEGDDLHLGIMLKAKTEISTDHSVKVALPKLPPLENIPLTPGQLAVALPVRVKYDLLRDALLKEFGGRTFTADVAGRKANATIRDVVVYPSRDRIALGLSFRAHVPGRLLDVSGKVFLTGKPVIENDGTLVRIRDVAFSREVDNPIWSFASAAFENQIKQALEENARFDLATAIAREVSELKSKLALQPKKSGMRIIIRDVSAGVDTIMPEAQDLAVLIHVNVGIDTEIQTLSLKSE